MGAGFPKYPSRVIQALAPELPFFARLQQFRVFPLAGLGGCHSTAILRKGGGAQKYPKPLNRARLIFGA